MSLEKVAVFVWDLNHPLENIQFACFHAWFLFCLSLFQFTAFLLAQRWQASLVYVLQCLLFVLQVLFINKIEVPSSRGNVGERVQKTVERLIIWTI